LGGNKRINFYQCQHPKQTAKILGWQAARQHRVEGKTGKSKTGCARRPENEMWKKERGHVKKNRARSRQSKKREPKKSVYNQGAGKKTTQQSEQLPKKASTQTRTASRLGDSQVVQGGGKPMEKLKLEINFGGACRRIQKFFIHKCTHRRWKKKIRERAQLWDPRRKVRRGRGMREIHSRSAQRQKYAAAVIRLRNKTTTQSSR